MNSANKPSSSKQKKRVTQADIARMTGVSTAVVSVALHGSAKGNIRVSPAVVKKIKALAKKEKYIPNQAARQLSLQHSKMWGILCDSRPTELNASRLALLHKAARDKGYRVIVEYYDRTRPDLNSLLAVFHNLGVDGVICLHHHFPNQHTLIPRLLTKHFDRVVFIDKPEPDKYFFCGVDYVEAGRAVYHALRQCGLRPGMALKNLLWYAAPLLAKGFTEEYKADHPRDDYMPVWTAESPAENDKSLFDIATARRALDLWALPNKLTGLAVFGDEQAVLVLNALQERGLRVPHDVAVIGIGNARICDLVRPTLSSVDLQVELAINAAVEMLYQLCQGGKPEITGRWIAPRLHLRQSCPPQQA
ncbi:MAG: LacI family DNA-binding transcriptional regulator [Kiritimatiellales bacterium]